MTPFLIAAWRGDDRGAAGLIERLKALLTSEPSRWTIASEQTDHLIAVSEGGRFTIDGNPRFPTVLIGDAFFRGQSTGEASPAPDNAAQFKAYCERLVTQRWGAYLAVAPGIAGRLQVLRDPVGMRDCVTWTAAGIRFVASDPVPWLYLANPTGLAIDWHLAASVLAQPSAVFETSLLTAPVSHPKASEPA